MLSHSHFSYNIRQGLIRCFAALDYSQTTIAGVIIVVAGVVMGIFFLKWFLLKSPQDHKVAIHGTPLGGVIASLANAIQIQITNVLYERLALWLNDLENHRTETGYEDALIAKAFLFQVRCSQSLGVH